LKKINQLILKSYLGPFLMTFAVVMFILLMQFVWKYIDDFVGKGLEWNLILELMFYVSVTLVPMALPLAILLASIMTFGNLAESYELTALKSAGMSLQKVMQP
jgi:lipopolysaccharide export system permease protein